jgi:DNA sulfur modification protein DndD
VIIDRLTLFDFGLYGGQHAIDLTPVSEKRPVILFGGMNGGGKTTLLDALNLVLYGVRAKTSNRNGSAYPDYLRSCIHRNSRGGSAWIELQFRHRSKGVDHSYVVTRSWRATDSGAREEFAVLRDGRHDRVLEEGWSDHVEEFLPMGLSRLFLFDGEKIETLADVNHSKDALGTAMASLLGLDVVEQLCLDLGSLETKKKVGLRAVGERAEIEALQTRIAGHIGRLKALTERAATVRTELDQRTAKVKALEEEFRKRGGDAFQSRETLHSEASRLENRIQEVEAALIEEAEGVLPLRLARELLASAENQAEREDQADDAQALVNVLSQRDAETLALVTAQGTKKAAAALEEFLRRDRERRLGESQGEAYLSLDGETLQLLKTTLHLTLPESQQRCQKLTAQLRELQDALVQVERKLQAVPDKEAIQRSIELLEKARIEKELAAAQLKTLESEGEEVQRVKGADEEKLSALMEKAVVEDFGREDEARVAAYAVRARSTLRAFRTEVVQRHVSRIESLVMECFRHLLRKQRLVESAHIDPETFSVELRNAAGGVVPTDRLSAGERQLFAVSVLWGLARAAGRPLPTVIDTPLGRLDGTHREHLVQRYFPNASHQVILLSTDKEIDREYYEQLKPFIGREYLLAFDEGTGKTSVKEGYFW